MSKVKSKTKVQITELEKPKVNAYVCGNLHITVTEDRDAGTTPMFIQCPQCPQPKNEKEARHSMAASSMYRVNQTLEATHEWYKPTETEMSELLLDMSENAFRQLAEHVKQGGLLIREKKGVKKLKELKEWWGKALMCIVDDDFQETRARIQKEVVELHEEYPSLLKKEDFAFFKITVKGGENE